MIKRVDILTLFPDMVRAAFQESIIARAISKGILEIDCHQIRDYTTNKQGKVDDYPYGGGPGLVMAYQPLRTASGAYRAPAREKNHISFTFPRREDRSIRKRRDVLREKRT